MCRGRLVLSFPRSTKVYRVAFFGVKVDIGRRQVLFFVVPIVYVLVMLLWPLSYGSLV